MSKKIIIKMQEGSERVEVIAKTDTGNGVKFVSINDIIAAFTEYAMESDFMDVMIPKNCIAASINRKGVRKAEFLVPGRKRPFFYYGDQYIIPMPTLHFRLDSRGSGEVWVEENGKTFMYPFGNVGRDDHICFGSVEKGEIKDFSDFIEWIEAFYASKTNDDYYSSKAVTVGEETLSQRELLCRLQDMETFPEEWLQPRSRD